MSNYLKKRRLEDVIRFIQLTGLRPSYQSTDIATTRDFGPPLSAKTWAILAEEHPELFRVSGNAADPRQRPLSLLARYFLLDEGNEQTVRPPLTLAEIHQLIELATKIHERQVRSLERIQALRTFVGTVILGLVTVWVTWMVRK